MSRFDSLGSAYMGSALLHLHGETVTVYPDYVGSYEIQAVVNREPAEEDLMGAPNAKATLEILDDATNGIDIGSLDRSTYRIGFSLERPGGTAQPRKILDFEKPVGGMITLYMQ